MPASSAKSQQFDILIILSIAMLIIGFIGIPKVWISEKNLRPVTGQLDSARSTVAWEFRQNRRRPNEVDKYHSSTLFIKLKGSSNDFILTQSIGGHYINDQFENILKALKSADSVTVWTESTNQELAAPKIYRIDCDSASVFEFHPLHLENSIATPILLIAGVLSTSLALIVRKRNFSTQV